MTPPPHPALHASHGGIWVAGEATRSLSRGEAIRLAADTPVILLNAPLVAQRLGYAELSGLDLLELFAFLFPARFMVPTPKGLAAATGLDAPARDQDVAAFLRAATAKLLSVPNGDWAEREGAWTSLQTLARLRWPWAPLLADRIAKPDKGEAFLFTRLPEWSEAAPRPAPRTVTLDDGEVRARLALRHEELRLTESAPDIADDHDHDANHDHDDVPEQSTTAVEGEAERVAWLRERQALVDQINDLQTELVQLRARIKRAEEHDDQRTAELLALRERETEMQAEINARRATRVDDGAKQWRRRLVTREAEVVKAVERRLASLSPHSAVSLGKLEMLRRDVAEARKALDRRLASLSAPAANADDTFGDEQLQFIGSLETIVTSLCDVIAEETSLRKLKEIKDDDIDIDDGDDDEAEDYYDETRTRKGSHASLSVVQSKVEEMIQRLSKAHPL